MDRGPAAGLTRRQWSQQVRPVQLHNKAKNAASAGSVGLNQLKIYHMANTRKIRSNHNSLLNFFIHDEKDLSKAYVDKCEKFIDNLGPYRRLADCFKMKQPKKRKSTDY